jgi:magnesium transporter
MRVFHVDGERAVELPAPPAQLAPTGFLWVGCERPAFGSGIADIQAMLQRWGIAPLVDLHVSDLLNQQLPSHFEYTSWYDLLVFRRLATAPAAMPAEPSIDAAKKALEAIDTSPVGFAVFDRVLITVHPPECTVLAYFAQRLTTVGTRLPASPADLMLRMVNHMVDSYLDLRRLLSKQLGALQELLLEPKSRFTDWRMLLGSRNALHLLEDTCEDQRAAVQEWIDGLDEWPAAAVGAAQRERELLRIRSRDVLEHIERVLTHVRRLEQSAEAAVQMHFSALGHRTNDIMRTLTVLTAVFLPLNLITGFFGMNFDFLPLIHSDAGFWAAVVVMVGVGVGLVAFFWRKRYLGTPRR